MGAFPSVTCVLIRKFCMRSHRENEEVDSNTGLTAKDKEVIRQSWKLISSNLKTESLYFLNMLFTEHPDYIDHFPAFRGMKLEEIKELPKFIVTAKSVFYTITLIVDSLDEPAELAEILLKMGRDHYHRNVTIEMFRTLPNVFDKSLTSRLGRHYTPAVRESWMKVFVVMNAIIEKGMEDAKAANLEEKKNTQDEEQSTDARL